MVSHGVGNTSEDAKRDGRPGLPETMTGTASHAAHSGHPTRESFIGTAPFVQLVETPLLSWSVSIELAFKKQGDYTSRPLHPTMHTSIILLNKRKAARPKHLLNRVHEMANKDRPITRCDKKKTPTTKSSSSVATTFKKGVHTCANIVKSSLKGQDKEFYIG